jgi:2,5-diamino-6-(ribosylamino)-4(3H)-pyrimidinone 5'-phosphate reductase
VSPLLKEETLKEVERALEELREESGRGTPVLVEGLHDRGALLSLGVEGEIVHLNGGRNLLSLLEDLEGHARAIVLTDFDREGEELALKCSRHLRAMGVKPLLDPRERLKKLLRKEVKDVEGMARFLLHLGAVGGKE